MPGREDYSWKNQGERSARHFKTKQYNSDFMNKIEGRFNTVLPPCPSKDNYALYFYCLESFQRGRRR